MWFLRSPAGFILLDQKKNIDTQKKTEVRG